MDANESQDHKDAADKNENQAYNPMIKGVSRGRVRIRMRVGGRVGVISGP